MKIDFKSILPWVMEELAKGRDRNDIFDELGLDENQRALMRYRIRQAEPIEEEVYTIRPERPRPKRFMMINGKRYQDITSQYIDCGG